MKIALVHLARGMDGTPVSPVVDHLGLESIAGNLQTEGHEVTLIDSGPVELGDDDVLGALCAAAPDLVGFALNYVNARDALVLVAKARREMPWAGFVAGGHYATFHADLLLRGEAPFDAVVLGEGERSMTFLAQTTGAHWMQVPGLALLHGNKVVRTGVVPPSELDELPIANRSILGDMASLSRSCVRVAVEASRGCRHNCNFCSIAACQALNGDVGRRRVRSPHIIAGEIATIVREWGLKDFWFMDADFLGDAKDQDRILEIAEAIQGLGHDLTLEIDTRADSVQSETIRALRTAGLERTFLGIESFDQKTLNSFSKGATVKGNLRAIETLLGEGVRPILGSIIFHPASTLEQIGIEHEYLSKIGYEKTQMLFRLKKYRGSRDASQSLDCEGRGIYQQEDYGWEIKDSNVRLVWNLFDRGRLKLLDEVFINLTGLFRQGLIDAIQFRKQADRIFHGLSDCMSLALEIAYKCKVSSLNMIIKAAEYEIDSLVMEIISSSTKL